MTEHTVSVFTSAKWASWQLPHLSHSRFCCHGSSTGHSALWGHSTVCNKGAKAFWYPSLGAKPPRLWWPDVYWGSYSCLFFYPMLLPHPPKEAPPFLGGNYPYLPCGFWWSCRSQYLVSLGMSTLNLGDDSVPWPVTQLCMWLALGQS